MKRTMSFAEKKAATEKIPAKPEMKEIATTVDGRDITRGYVDAMPTLQPADSVLQARSGGDFILYDEVMRDPQVKACLQQRWQAVASKEWEVEPGDDSAPAKKAADSLEEIIMNIAWDDTTCKMLSGEFYGFAVGEAMWATDGSMIYLDSVKVRNQKRFAFTPAGEMRMLTMAQPLAGEALPPAKFWCYSTGAWNDDDPYGLGLAHWLYWPVFFKRNDIKFWLIFLEKFGQPTAVGKYPATATELQKANLLDALSAIQTDSGIRIPEAMTIELLEASRSGTADYTALHDRMDAAISKVILGHTGSTDATPGRLGGETNAASVRDDLIKASADLVCMSFNRTIAKWLTLWNFGENVPVPKVWRRVESEPDLKLLADRDKVIFDMGFKPTLKYVSETYDIEVTETQQQGAISGQQDAQQQNAGGASQNDAQAQQDAQTAQDQADMANPYRDHGGKYMGQDVAGIALDPLKLSDATRTMIEDVLEQSDHATRQSIWNAIKQASDENTLIDTIHRITMEARHQAATSFSDIKPPNFTPQQQAVEDIANEAMAKPVQPIDEELIQNAVRAATSPEDLENRLAILLAEQPNETFTRYLERGLFAADVLGYAHADGK